MDEYQYPLFFAARDLTDRERGKVTRHFQKRKDSGGGECLTIAKAGAKTYKVCFKEKEDQERVLQRKFHTIPLPDGDLRLTVSRTDSPQMFDQPSTSQSQTFTKPNAKTLKKIFKPDIFLLFYLRDNLKANKLLQKQLSAIGCTAEFDLDEEWAVVWGDMDKGSGSAFVSAAENWELQVDRVFISLTERYLCYHVVEPKQAKILMQDLTFVTDDIKVYTESGYPVIVGDNDAVKDRIAILEKSLPTRKELPIAERQFKVVEEEFNREICTHCPEVKIHRGNATIILEGPDKEVKSGATKLDELIRKVKEKRVKLPTAILTFITSSGAISKYQARFQQSLRNPVSIEMGSDLVLSSVSTDALDDAEATIKKELRLDNVQLQGAAAVPPDLDRVKEILMKAKNEANFRELRVDVSFIPGPSAAAICKVQLLGYSENVNKLKELLHNYQMNQIWTQELLSLPHPELVDCFHDVLKMIGMKQNKLTFGASHFPYPSVVVSGPRCLVKDVQTQLNATLASLTKDTLVLDGPAAQRYFQAEGKMSKELVESSCQVIIREQQGVSGTTSSLGTTTKQQQQPPSLSASTDLSILHSTSTSQKSIFIFLGLSRQDVDDAMTKLKFAYQSQCSTQTLRHEELVGLTQDDVEDLRQLVESHGLNIQRDQSGPESLTVSGFKDGVNQVTKKINDSLQENLRREVRAREEEELFSRVVWCILGINGKWERLPKTANYKLENNDIAGGIVDAQGTEWSVDAQRSGASRRIRGQTTKLKRLVNHADFTLPLEWDNMVAGEVFKVVALQPSSAEYKSVKEGFKRTVSKTVMKIERLQNVHLRRAYEAQKKHISDNRRQEGGAGEKFLYHGTTQENCDSIMKTGFNRRFAGQNATSYGRGTYFAVNAYYSAHPTYSKPAADGSQLMFVARVLTGVYTQGSSNMKVPPPRTNSQPHDRCDSVVDKIDNPKMYVVFHDNQAYPDYLITFK